MPSRSHLYDDPAVYDILHAPGTVGEVDGLEAIEDRFVPGELTRARRLWLEPACGSGRYLREAARRGIGALGFDLSDAMIDYARANSPASGPGVGESDYFVGDMTDFAGRMGRARATFAFNLINTIRHLPSDAAMLAHFDHMARVLAPGGVYVVGLSLTAYGCEAPTEDVWKGSRAGTRVTQIVQFIPPRWEGNPRTRSEKVLCHLMVAAGGGPAEHRDSTYRLRTYSLAQWEALIARSPLGIVASIDERGADHPAADGGYCLFVLGRS
ncbi:MAG TPA: class I SAM-dependent methyltransferase [Phycisphaerales bacterium]|nr:class I SAM-dependent methyltransferase [Phycisphaerales bacterium]